MIEPVGRVHVSGRNEPVARLDKCGIPEGRSTVSERERQTIQSRKKKRKHTRTS